MKNAVMNNVQYSYYKLYKITNNFGRECSKIFKHRAEANPISHNEIINK